MNLYKNLTTFMLSVVISFFVSNIYASEQILLEGGVFEMGSYYCEEEQNNSDWCNDETPHKVQVGPFWMDKFEVTNAEYRKCFVAGVCEPEVLHEDRPGDFNKDNQPVVFTTWKEASTYCNWRNGRLPTEAEWEFAANVERPGGAHWNQPYGVGSPVSVGNFGPNSHGLYDMMGNVYEWTKDWYGSYPKTEIQKNPLGPAKGKNKVVRGGSWDSLGHFLRTSDRVAKDPDLRYSGVGFRCVKAKL
jgi:formylglycine-generating enzyme required for sulfatase activity